MEMGIGPDLIMMQSRVSATNRDEPTRWTRMITHPKCKLIFLQFPLRRNCDQPTPDNWCYRFHQSIKWGKDSINSDLGKSQSKDSCKVAFLRENMQLRVVLQTMSVVTSNAGPLSSFTFIKCVLSMLCSPKWRRSFAEQVAVRWFIPVK